MLFSVDAHAIGRHLTGNEVYIRNLVSQFPLLDPEATFVAYVSVNDTGGWVPEQFLRRRVSANPFVRLGWELTARLWRDRPVLLHVQYTAPLGCPVPVVVTVHDVSFLEHPEFFSPARAAQLRWSVKRTVQRAKKILTVSEFSRRAIEKAYALPPGRVIVAPNAASSLFRPIDRAAAAARVRARFGIPSPYVLTVGDVVPRKNQLGLVRAFASMLRHDPRLPHHLVIAGKETRYGRQVRRAARESGAAERIHFTGFVSDDDLLQLYNACELFVFPSFYEGFGLPVLEAMACGRAVVCSNTSAIPEVADAAAILVDPRDTSEIARAMRDVLVDAELRLRLERLALHRAAQFSWRKTAERTLAVYYEVAGVASRVPADTVQSVSVARP
ncbi:MAG: glycosyltransferase family 1 protein [Bryobacterales bacterium]|nr:glycosyltransferase family 4 protein [Bryobacteraceae bacterium]MDW8355358.1 glycosyltransferase family 1 protein [Bryobacterales bacterium]